jgi:CRP-like cAMP-binding protein
VFEKLKHFCASVVPLTDEHLAIIDSSCERRVYRKRALLHKVGDICRFMAFIESGTVRIFHISRGVDYTSKIYFENGWVTDFPSFTSGLPGQFGLQALEETVVTMVQKEKLEAAYRQFPALETIARITTEKVLLRTAETALFLSSDKPEDRFRRLLAEQPNLFQRVPQKYIASLLGISPESLSRIRKRLKS